MILDPVTSLTIKVRHWCGVMGGGVEKDRLVAVDEVARYLGCTVQSVYQLVYLKKIPYYKLGTKTLRFHRGEIEDWLVSKYSSRTPEKRARQAHQGRLSAIGIGSQHGRESKKGSTGGRQGLRYAIY